MITYGFDLNNIADDAKANGNIEFAELLEEKIAEHEKAEKDLQACYDIIAEKQSSTGERLWNIDVEYLKEKLQ